MQIAICKMRFIFQLSSLWLSLLHDTGYLNDREYRSIQTDCIEIEKIITSILKTAKANDAQ